MLAIYLALAVATAYFLDVPFIARIVAFVPFVIGLFVVSLALGVAVLIGRIGLVERSGRPLYRLWQEIRRYAQPQIATRAALLIAAALALQVIYSFFKPQISRFGPYRWDAGAASALAAWWFAGKILAWWRERSLTRTSDLELATP